MSAPQLVFYITTLDYSVVGGDPSANLGRLSNFTAGQVKIPMNDAREASVTVSVYDPLISDAWFDFNQDYGVYLSMLKVYYGGSLVFWGPIVTVEGDIGAGTLKLNAVDPTIRLQHHYVRYGDAAEEHSDVAQGNHFGGSVPVDGRGLKMLRDAGENTIAQNVRGVPPLGIVDGIDDSFNAPESRWTKIKRGDEVWSTMKDLCSHVDGPDMDVFPVDGFEGVYARLDIYNLLGFENTAVTFHKGWGKDNCDNIVWTTGGTLVTHDHVLSSDNKFRKTVADTSGSAMTGPYVKWDTTNYEIKSKDNLGALQAWGEEVLRDYGRPNNYFTITPRNDVAQTFFFMQDFYIGDTVTVAVKRGNIKNLHEVVDITQVRLNQDGNTTHCRTEIDVALTRRFREGRPD